MEEDNKDRKNQFIEQFAKLMQDTVIAPNDDYIAKTQPILDLIRENTPKSLFRFRDFNEFTIDAFWKDSIFHSAPKSFNDPHDCLVYVDKPLLDNIIEKYLMPQNIEILIKQWQDRDQQPDNFFSQYEGLIPKTIETLKNIPGVTAENYDKITETHPNSLHDIEEQFIKIMGNVEKIMYSHFRTDPKIACYSENIESTLMWAHYANQHKGFALEYDFTKEQSKCLVCENPCRDKAHTNLYPVIYSNKRYNATELAAFFFINQCLKELGVPEQINIPDRFTYTKANIYKGEDWKYEKEWRTFLVCNGNPERNNITVKPKAIYIGAETSPIHQDILVNYAKTKEIGIYKMEIDTYSDEYKLTYYEI